MLTMDFAEPAARNEEVLRDVVISHEGEHEPEGDDGDNGADGDDSRRRRGRAA